MERRIQWDKERDRDGFRGRDQDRMGQGQGQGRGKTQGRQMGQGNRPGCPVRFRDLSPRVQTGRRWAQRRKTWGKQVCLGVCQVSTGCVCTHVQGGWTMEKICGLPRPLIPHLSGPHPSTHSYSLRGACSGPEPPPWDWLEPSEQLDQGRQDVGVARLKGQEGSLRRDNRWKGRRNWE